jgi:hypothetical protein
MLIDKVRIVLAAGARQNPSAFWSAHLADVMKNLDRVTANIAAS